MDNQHNIAITIGRQFGSGGRVIARRLAEMLGCTYYDKELLLEAARHSGMSPDIVERSDERLPRFMAGTFSFAMGCNPYTLYSGPQSIGGENVNRALGDIIVKAASEGPCVIVGRTADYVLRHHPALVSVFVHAPIEQRIARIMERGDSLTQQQARTLAEKTDKLRASYYNFYTDRTWGAASTYHLTVDSSLMPIDETASLIAEYIRRRFPR